MKTKICIILAVIILSFRNEFLARETVFQPIDTSGKIYSPESWNEIDSIHLYHDESEALIMDLATEKGLNLSYDLSSYHIFNGQAVPLVVITTEEELEQIPDKINYKKANIEIKGFGVYDDFSNEVSIRGRGNSSWTLSDKKPYRLKFDKKVSLCGLNKAKSFVLTANWTDESLMQNSIASFIGKMFNIPYTHTYIPVDVILNGVYRGSYLLTNKPGINAGSVDIDEDNSVMWELDINFDEDLKFISDTFEMPVMLADPDLDETHFELWKEDYNEMEKGVNEGRASEYIDLDEYVRYRMIYYLFRVNDIGFPKSLKLYKTKGGKYNFGPIWDFDVAMGFNWDDRYSLYLASSYFWESALMVAIDKDPMVQELIRKYLVEFFERENEVWDFIDDYANTIELSALRNNIAWSYKNEDWQESVSKMKLWLQHRFQFIKEKYEIQ